ncbi:uncharacterized protein TNCV_4533441 [Trichonephila clavipes]|nr:uncharacterized protein TNCV_4533441 [Trichonephila clavipes]
MICSQTDKLEGCVGDTETTSNHTGIQDRIGRSNELWCKNADKNKSRGGPVNWPTKSQDLSYMDFFWGHRKSLVYETPVPSVEDLIPRSSVAARRTLDIPGTFQNVKNSMQCHSQACQKTSRRNFEYLI